MPVLHGTVTTTGAYSSQSAFRFASQSRSSCREVGSTGTTNVGFTLGAGARVTHDVVLNFGLRLAPYRGAGSYAAPAFRSSSVNVGDRAQFTSFVAGPASEISAVTRADASGYAVLNGLTSRDGNRLSVLVTWKCRLDDVRQA